MTTKKKQKPGKSFILVEVEADQKAKLQQIAVEKDWSMRKTIKHAIKAYTESNG